MKINQYSKSCFALLFIILLAGSSMGFLRKRLLDEEMVGFSDLIVRGEVTEVSDFGRGTLQARLRVDEMIYGVDNLKELKLLCNPNPPASTDEHILGRTFSKGDAGVFFIRHIPRGLAREFSTLSTAWWSPEVATLQPCGLDDAIDYFFVPYSEMFWPTPGADDGGEKALQERLKKIYPNLQEKLETDIERYSTAQAAAKKALARIK